MMTPTCSRPSTDRPAGAAPAAPPQRVSRARGAVAVAALLLLSSNLHTEAAQAQAQAPTPESEGFRARYDRGVGLYNTGQYDRAIDEFRAAYELKQVPIILFSLAQAHRKAGHYKEAMETYERFLGTDPKEQLKAEAQKFLEESKAALAAQDEEKRKAEEKAAAEKAAAEKAAAEKAAAEKAAAEAEYRKKYGPGRPLNIAKWAVGTAGVLTLVAGAVLMGLDGRPTCDRADGQKLCPEELATIAPGGVLLGAGALMIGGSAALFVLDHKHLRDHAPRPLGSATAALSLFSVRF
jgi:tetratricopeptide (TPR) repeat protein